MRQLVFAAVTSLLLVTPTVFAQEAAISDDIVRLPGQGIMKSDDFYAGRKHTKSKKLVPGGGLIISFDENMDGTVTKSELLSGANAAFHTADANNDGDLTALEQIEWAESLPTRDDTLANPLRFNPNLDRTVSLDEFVSVIENLANDYAKNANGKIQLAALEARGGRQSERPDTRRPQRINRAER